MQPNKSSSQTRYSEIWFPEGFRWIDYTICNPWNIFCERYLSPLTTTFETFCSYVTNNYDILPQFCDCHIYIVVTKANLWANWTLEIIIKAQLCFHKISIIHTITHCLWNISSPGHTGYVYGISASNPQKDHIPLQWIIFLMVWSRLGHEWE